MGSTETKEELDESIEAFETLSVEELRNKAKTDPKKLELGVLKSFLGCSNLEVIAKGLVFLRNLKRYTIVVSFKTSF